MSTQNERVMTHAGWLSQMRSVADRLAVARDANRIGYDPAEAQQLRAWLHSQPSHELVAAHCGSNPHVAEWGRRVVANGLLDSALAVLRTLPPGEAGGIL